MISNTLVTNLGSNDVLLGRGTGPNEHGGNKRFRTMAQQVLKSINCSSSRVPISKLDLAKQLVAMVHAKKGKFVRKLTRAESELVARQVFKSSDKKFFAKHNVHDLYVVVPEDVAVDKAKQSFRHQLRLILENDEGNGFLPSARHEKSSLTNSSADTSDIACSVESKIDNTKVDVSSGRYKKMDDVAEIGNICLTTLPSPCLKVNTKPEPPRREVVFDPARIATAGTATTTTTPPSLPAIDPGLPLVLPTAPTHRHLRLLERILEQEKDARKMTQSFQVPFLQESQIYARPQRMEGLGRNSLITLPSLSRSSLIDDVSSSVGILLGWKNNSHSPFLGVPQQHI